MTKLNVQLFRFLFLTLPSAALLFPATINIGYVAFDVTNAPLAEVDIVNLTGANSVPPSFPVSTSESLTNLSLTVNFKSGPAEVFSSASGYFTLDSDGLSFDGQDIFNTGTNPVTSVELTGDFATTSITSGGSAVTILPTFSATITDASGALADGDFALITATTTGSKPPPPGVPEPRSYLLLCLGLAALSLNRYKRILLSGTQFRRLGLLFLASCLGLFASSAPVTPITLSANTSPSSGTAGQSDVWVTGSGFPSGAFVSATASLATKCGATGTTAAAIAEKDIVGSVERVEFLVPASLATGQYYVSLSGSTTGGAFSSEGSCSVIKVTHVNPVLASCNPGSSMGISTFNPTGAATTPVTAYVPNGYWEGGGNGVQVVPIEGGGATATVPTTNTINSCSSNSLTGETVCIDNTTGIYLVNGKTLTTTLASGATAYASFSGGECENCTVAVNEAAGTKGQAVIGMGFAGAPSGTALQFLDLATNKLGTPVPMNDYVSEDILWDPFRNVILSPDESSEFPLYKVTGSGIPGPTNVFELTNEPGQFFDSAGEDCTTQITLLSTEDAGNIYISDLSQSVPALKTVSSSVPYTAPGQVIDIPEFDEFSAGTDGIAVAPGSTHLAVVTGEFGGNQFGAILLPATSGKGTPAPVDWVAAVLPATPDGCGYSSGYDPHTTTAYTSPNNGKAYGVLADWVIGNPSYLAVVDLAALLKAPRKAGIYPDGSPCGSCVNTVDPTYDLVKNGIVTYVPTGNPTCGEAIPADLTTPKPVNKLPVKP